MYDRVNYPNAGVTQLAFFSTPRGQAAVLITGIAAAAAKIKDLRDTNMDNANVVPTKMFKFVGISMAYITQIPGATTDGADRDRVRNNAWLTFTIVDKTILNIPLLCIPEVNPLVVGATTGNNVTICAAAGDGGQNVPMYKLPIPITLNPYENFSVTINLSAAVALAHATSSMDVGIILQGFMRRPT